MLVCFIYWSGNAQCYASSFTTRGSNIVATHEQYRSIKCESRWKGLQLRKRVADKKAQYSHSRHNELVARARTAVAQQTKRIYYMQSGESERASGVGFGFRETDHLFFSPQTHRKGFIRTCFVHIFRALFFSPPPRVVSRNSAPFIVNNVQIIYTHTWRVRTSTWSARPNKNSLVVKKECDRNWRALMVTLFRDSYSYSMTSKPFSDFYFSTFSRIELKVFQVHFI